MTFVLPPFREENNRAASAKKAVYGAGLVKETEPNAVTALKESAQHRVQSNEGKKPKENVAFWYQLNPGNTSRRRRWKKTSSQLGEGFGSTQTSRTKHSQNQ